jgi:hypothetical protein
MNEILTTAIAVLALLAGLAALIRYAAQDVFAGPFTGPHAEYDVTDPRDAETTLGLSRR